MNPSPIGIFDSGVGGLTVWREIRKLLPNEQIIYFADSKNCPYGNKPQSEIIHLAIEIVSFLLNKNCKLIVVACNTATAAAIEFLRQNYSIPFVGMEPAVKPAALNTQSGKIGILATKGTFEGRLFQETSRKYTENIQTHIQVGEGLVELVESNEYQTDKAKHLLLKYLQPMMDAGVDQIVLGCTHYPFYTSIIEQLTGNKIRVIDPAPAVANRTRELLIAHDLLNISVEPGKDVFYTSGETEVLRLLVTNITGQPPLVLQN
jgi:glutamate racemase